jgi:N-acetylglucosamine kinase-like BadF-type ATPase
MKTPVLIGIDGGGTKTLAAAMEATGSIDATVPTATAGPSNIAALQPDVAADSIVAAATAALERGGWSSERVGALCAGVAGYSHEANRLIVTYRLQVAFPNARVQVCPDYVTAYDGALAGLPGVAVIAGTGQVAYGEDGSGRTGRAGGYGYLIDDAGSGYGVGRSAIAAVLNAWDTSGPQTSLTATVPRLLSVTNAQEMIAGIYGGSIDRVRIASLAEAVAHDADNGDAVATTVLRDAGGSLAMLAVTVAGMFWSMDEAVAVATTGSLWKASILRAEFGRALRETVPNARIVSSALEPVIGAALRSRRLLDMEQGGTVH